MMPKTKVYYSYLHVLYQRALNVIIRVQVDYPCDIMIMLLFNITVCRTVITCSILDTCMHLKLKI